MSLIPWSGGSPLVWDATCVYTLAASHVSITSKTAGAAAASAESLKKLDRGPWGSNAWLLFKDLSKKLVGEANDQRAGCLLRVKY